MEIPPAPSHHRPWSDLPADLLQPISSNLFRIKDYIHFRSICSSWRSAAKPHNLPPQFPLLFLPHNPSSSLRAFFNLSNRNHFTRRFLEEVPCKFVIGSSYGWLALLDDAAKLDVLLWNPFTGSMIRLPHIIKSACKVCLTAKPMSENCVVIVVFDEAIEFAFCKLGDETWTVVKTGLKSPVVSVEFFDGRFFAFDGKANGFVLDSAVMIHSPDIIGIDYLIEQVHVVKRDTGLLLMILCYRRFDGDRMRIGVFELDEDGGSFKWKRIRSLGKYAIFLSENHSSIVCARDLFGCREDCIYFSAICGSSDQNHQRGVPYIDIFDMKEKRFQPIKCSWLIITDEQNATWVAPSIEYIQYL